MAVIIVAASPFAHLLARGLPTCRIKVWTGLPCPTCGTTRSALHLADFDLLAALSAYPLMTIGWIVVVGGGLVAGIAALAGHGVPELPRSLPGWCWWSLLALVLANWLYLIATGV